MSDWTPPSLEAIPTRYRGVEFRSRLEARWAVLLDHLQVKWQYEPQGFMCSTRITNWGYPTTLDLPYLPDFWLPDLHLWAEVKGSWRNEEAIRRFANCAAHISTAGGDGCGHYNGPDAADMLLLGQISPTGRPFRLHMHKGDLIGTISPFESSLNDESAWDAAHSSHRMFANDMGEFDAEMFRSAIADPWHNKDHPVDWRWKDATTAARSAKFEHGRSG